MKLNLSDEPITAELLGEALRRAGSATIGVNGNSMHPTLQMGWRVHLLPVDGADLKVGQIAVFRGGHHLTIHRLAWKEHGPTGATLVFRGDYNRVRERVAPGAVIARVVAIEVPGRRKGQQQVHVLHGDVLGGFYRVSYALYAALRPLLPGTASTGSPPGPLGRAARALFGAAERFVSLFLRDRR
jgi:signal peptidase I